MSEMVPADQGRIRVVVIPDPVVATNFQFTQDIRTRWRVVCLKFQYVADANASNRIVSVGFTVAGTLAFSTPARVLIVAGETWNISFFEGGSSITPAGGRVQTGCLPPKYLINGQTVIGSAVDGIQAGDQISVISLTVEEWIEPLV